MPSYHKVVSQYIHKTGTIHGDNKYIVTYETSTEESKDIVQRFLKNALFLCSHGLGPRIIDIRCDESDYYTLSITYERINIIDSHDIETFPDTPENLVNSISKQIQRLHNLGYGHGDIIGNFGYRQYYDGSYKILLVDPDSMFKISKARDNEYFIEWCREAYDMKDETVDEMIENMLENDLTGWKNDELDL